MKLIVCAGDRKIPGFTTHDIQGEQDILCDLYDVAKHVGPSTVEELHFTHALEHFPTKETPKVLDLLYSLLKPGGKLYLEVPNFAWSASLLDENRDRDAIYYAFGGQLDEYDFHKTGFTKKILQEELEDAGFTVTELKDDSTLCCWSEKPL
jgi:predicted SAM-dependent methyltransferase